MEYTGTGTFACAVYFALRSRLYMPLMLNITSMIEIYMIFMKKSIFFR